MQVVKKTSEGKLNKNEKTPVQKKNIAKKTNVAQGKWNKNEKQPAKKKKTKKTAKSKDTASGVDTGEDELDQFLAESSSKRTNKTENTTKAKKQKVAHGEDSDSDEEGLEALELAYLKKRSLEEANTGGSYAAPDDDSDEPDYWSDSDEE